MGTPKQSLIKKSTVVRLIEAESRKMVTWGKVEEKWRDVGERTKVR